MNAVEETPNRPRAGKNARKVRLAGMGGLIAAGAVVGGILANSGGALAATSSSTTPSSGTSTTTAPSTTTTQPAAGTSAQSSTPVRTDEKATTDTIAATVKTKALAAVPGGTVYRIETDAGDATYEAHMTKADGTLVTVKFDTNLNVTGVESGMGQGDPAGGGPAGGGGPAAGAPGAPAPSNATA
ncbi:MAG: hypothetical protein QOG69_2698 [Actinomycetota bacterium]|nr:hypothetical protein [Actinomycetota bacterium]